MQAHGSAVSVGDLMTIDPVLAAVDMTLDQAAELMEFYKVNGLPVVDWSGYLVGVVSQTDLVHARLRDDFGSARRRLIVRHAMSRPALTITADLSLLDAARLMEHHHVHRLVVVADDDDAVPIGIISTTDLVREIAEGADPPAH